MAEATTIKKDTLRLLFDILKESYTVVGPIIRDSVVVLSPVDFDDIPFGNTDHQEPGIYRAGNVTSGIMFSFSIGPDSGKRFLFPPVHNLYDFTKSKTGISIRVPVKEETPMLLFGLRACDLAALRLLDKVFLEGPHSDPIYDYYRRSISVVAINCASPHSNCFCSSMDTGPEVKAGADITITELGESFLLEKGLTGRPDILKSLPGRTATEQDMDEKKSRIDQCGRMIKKRIETAELPMLLYRNLEHSRWQEVEDRCLSCGNCTQVCPTCFCNTGFDYLTVSGISKKPSAISGTRMRSWDSCFSANFARVHGGNFRPSARARYRQWMSHKLAYWIDQFGAPGCVGCGRCITWCPVGIDITEELRALKDVR